MGIRVGVRALVVRVLAPSSVALGRLVNRGHSEEQGSPGDGLETGIAEDGGLFLGGQVL